MVKYSRIVCVCLAVIICGTAPGATNLLKNTSFENNTVPPSPDCWGLIGGGVREPSMIANMFQWWGIDTSTAYHGTTSMRIYRPCNITDPCNLLLAGQDMQIVSIWYENVALVGNSYVFSVYLKSDQPVMNVKLEMQEQTGVWYYYTTVQVNQTWTRYSLATSGPLPSAPSPTRFYVSITPQNTGTTWIDAAQFETGTTPTTYQVSQYDLNYPPAVDTSIPLISLANIPYAAAFNVTPELNVYMSEPNAKIFVAGGSAGNLRYARIKLLSADSSTVLEQHDVPYSDIHVYGTFSIASLADGNYPVVADLMDPVQGQISEKTSLLRKRAVKAHSVRINNVSRMLVADGNAFVPYGCFYDLSLLTSGPSANRAFAEMAGRFNCIVIPVNYPPPSGITSTLSATMDRADAQGLKASIWYVPFIKASTYSSAIADMERIVKAVEGKRAMLGWVEVTDEEEVDQTVYNRVKPRVDWLRARDPYHPIFHSDHRPSFDTWKPYGYVGDIIELHCYAWGSPWETGVASYVNGVINAGLTGKDYGKPVQTMPQSFCSMQFWSRSPSADELTAAIFSGITQDSKIFQFYQLESVVQTVYNRIGAMKSEVDALVPAMASYEEGYIVSPSDQNILVVTKRVNGTYYIITVNVSPQQKTIVLNTSDLRTAASTANVLFENRIVAASGGHIQDVYQGYQRHVYTLNGCSVDLSGDISGPAGISDCRIDFYDFATLAADWLKINGNAQ